MSDLTHLYQQNPSCNLWDYYRYQLYLHPHSTPLYREVLGSAVEEELNQSLNKRTGVTPAWDKLLFAVICHTYDIPTARIVAVYKPQGPIPDFIPTEMHSLDQVKHFLIEYQAPLFVKPAQSHLAKGVYYLDHYDPAADRVFTKDQQSFSFAEFIDKTINVLDTVRYNRRAGYLFQQPIVQHPLLTEFTGTEIPSGFRIIVLNDADGARVHRVIWKLIAAGNVSDNFNKGISGNLVVYVNPITGELSDAVDNFWPYAHRLSQHPVSGKCFKDFTLPLWQSLLTQVCRASESISSMSILHWDVILGPDGPVMIEVNDLGGSKIPQLHGIGLLDNNLRQFIKRNAQLRPNSRLQRQLGRQQPGERTTFAHNSNLS
ncbi:hypothetical protein WG68_02835 [Arsukibacterium ikkense]|uniref:Alpha-L-glutamate ligase-related protein ATP-grasp domain-containing protein n=2 Tax=Arsukibacterium ikkense TaxID=336831 RepID=A0A0M2V8E8_9GAMM|nr:hypothetical protein WG68_02835 [Arsukibacterium ikkense]